MLTHNGLEHTTKCLASIEACTPEPHELIIVDNASTDGTLDYLRGYMAAHDNVRAIANRTNRGFAAGNNQGLALAGGEYVLLLNNDTIVTAGWLTRMLRIFGHIPTLASSDRYPIMCLVHNWCEMPLTRTQRSSTHSLLNGRQTTPAKAGRPHELWASACS
ncbi:MAG: glycosyltransferase [Candidatus Methylomirabilis sp.]|nr:glycosyltransferase [Candidatus Methylomirabilis sp.]